jgi:hypothetical protein
VHRGTRTLIIRILKIVSPIQRMIPDYDGFITCPTEGDLVMQRGYQSYAKPRAIDVDNEKYATFRTLIRDE